MDVSEDSDISDFEGEEGGDIVHQIAAHFISCIVIHRKPHLYKTLN